MIEWRDQGQASALDGPCSFGGGGHPDGAQDPLRVFVGALNFRQLCKGTEAFEKGYG